MVGGAGVAHHQLAGHALAAEHAGHQSGVVKADAGLLLQHGVQHGQVAALHGGSQLVVVGHVLDHVVVDELHLLQGIGGAARQLLSLGNGLGGVLIVDVLVGTQEGSKLVGEGDGHLLGEHGGVLGAAGVLIDHYLVGAVAVGQGEGGPGLALGQVVGIGGGGALHLDLQALVGGGHKAHHDVAVLGVGVVDLGLVVLLHLSAGGHRGKHGGHGGGGGHGHGLILQVHILAQGHLIQKSLLIAAQGLVALRAGLGRAGALGLGSGLAHGGISAAAGQQNQGQSGGQQTLQDFIHRDFLLLSG